MMAIIIDILMQTGLRREYHHAKFTGNLHVFWTAGIVMLALLFGTALLISVVGFNSIRFDERIMEFLTGTKTNGQQ